MAIYNKLVRDKIPEIIKNDNKKCTTRILDHEDYVVELKKKLAEELEEYQEAHSDKDALEELADILELLHALAATHGASIDYVEEVRREKAQMRGGFKERIFLIEVED